MENKKGSLSTVFLVIAIILIVVMGVLLYIQKTEADRQITELENNASKLQETINDLQGKIDTISNTINSKDETDNTSNENKSNSAVLELSPIGGTAVLYNGEVYVNVYDSTPNIDNIYGEGKFQTLRKTREAYAEYEFDSLTINNNDKKWSKLNISNVKAIYNNEYGQATSPTNPKYGIIMLNEDKTVSYISISSLIEGKVETTKLNANDITNVETEDDMGYTTYLVDANGNKKDVNNYIK